MHIRYLTCTLLVVLATALLGACASNQSGTVYSRDEARAMQEVQTGTVVDVRPVTIEGTKSGAGTIAGGVLGGIAGSGAGGGTGRALAAAAGAVVGALGGSAVEEGITREKGLQITVKLDGGRTVAIVQKADQVFNAGDRVQLTTYNGTTHVSPDNGTTQVSPD